MNESSPIVLDGPDVGPNLQRLHALGALSALDVELGLALRRRFPTADALSLMTAALTSRAVQQGHVCLDLRALAATPLLGDSEQPIPLTHPEPAQWADQVQRSPLCCGPAPPLCVERGQRVYLRRYARYQQQLLTSIRARLARSAPFDADALRDGLARYFPPSSETDWQRVAALLAVSRPLTIVSGGPGTGKTTTVARLLGLLAEQYHARGQRLELQMVAPTGKAAQRLTESLHAGLEALPSCDAIKDQLRVQTATIHRALGFQVRTPTRFSRGPDNPLLANVVVVDEASMIDLALMAKLFQAIALDARLILLGDKDQLASVEAGAVFGDLFQAESEPRYGRATVELVEQLSGDQLELDTRGDCAIGDSVVHLRKSYRYAGDSGIGALARAIRDGDPQAAFDALNDHRDLEWIEVPEHENDDRETLRRVERLLIAGYQAYADAAGASHRARQLNRFRVLCPHRSGPLGVAHVNELAEAALFDVPRGSSPRFYAGRPLLITENDYQLELFNGDVGVVDRDDKGRLLAYFPNGERLRQLQTGRLPPHETVFAMTVHKSQGSEFDRVGLILPNAASPIITRELLYTAVTRARSGVTVVGSRQVLAAGIARRIQRSSGLREALWGERP